VQLVGGRAETYPDKGLLPCLLAMDGMESSLVPLCRRPGGETLPNVRPHTKLCAARHVAPAVCGAVQLYVRSVRE
jgi:hypothetical protein